MFEGGERAGGSSEAGDVVVGRQVPVGAHGDSRSRSRSSRSWYNKLDEAVEVDPSLVWRCLWCDPF